MRIARTWFPGLGVPGCGLAAGEGGWWVEEVAERVGLEVLAEGLGEGVAGVLELVLGPVLV